MRYELTRAQLYEAVWAEPIQRLATRIGLSDVALTKACKRVGVPTPGRGYWAKLRAGKQVTRPPLPPRPLGIRDRIALGKCRSSLVTTPTEAPAEIPNPASYSESLEEIGARIRRMMGPLRIAKTLGTVHPCIAKLLERDEQRAARMREIPDPMLCDGPIFQSRIETRHLLILNSLFLALSRFGATALLRGRDARELSVRIGDAHVPFKLDHSTSKQSVPCDRLRLEICQWWRAERNPLSWEDSDTTLVDDNLSEIIFQMLFSAELHIRRAALEEQKEAARRKAKLLEEEKMRKEQIDQEARDHIEHLRQVRVGELIGNAAAWRQATDIRGYVRAVVDAQATMQGKHSAEWKQWSAWALREADMLDPSGRQSYEDCRGHFLTGARPMPCASTRCRSRRRLKPVEPTYPGRENCLSWRVHFS